MGIATTTLAATTRQLSDGNSQGTVLGINAADKIGFYGATPASQPTSSWQSSVQNSTAAAAVSTPTGAVTVWGYSSAAQANSVLTSLAAIQAALVANGLWKGS